MAMFEPVLVAELLLLGTATGFWLACSASAAAW